MLIPTHIICVCLKKDFLFWCSFSAFNMNFPQFSALIRVKCLLILSRSLFTPIVLRNCFRIFVPFCILFICIHFLYQCTNLKFYHLPFGCQNPSSWQMNLSQVFLKVCGMGPLLVLLSPCFKGKCSCHMQNLVFFFFFVCNLDNLLQKNVIVFFFGNQISKLRSFEKRAIFDLLFTFFSYQGKVTKIPSAHISLTYIHVFCSPYWHCLPYQFWKKKYEFIRYGFSLLWVLVLILIRPVWNNQ